ncbi:acyltransferase family protein [Massilia endophytica]|uniref:acyltransferase family protein n=1 Tax=Massilia endophytica TaxID=2899220 RepID=UPI001E475645|nr:acyltransferase [Massilia endophytica]UGQ48242.1 acyltransferase [Massilia endophytica]
MHEQHIAARNHGLDTLRTIAIVLVLMYHYMVVVTGENTFGVLTEIGWTGVDLFFVLSGYLIGNQIFSSLRRDGSFSLRTFYARRLLRTLPNYFVVLALYWLLPQVLAGSSTASLWRFLSFTQNFGMHPGETFTHSWSLCIEEQFYMILPLAALLLAGRKKGLAFWWTILAGAIAAGIAVRSHAWNAHGAQLITNADYYEYIYYNSLARFDELLPGVAIALMKNYSPALFARITRHGNALLAAGTAAVLITFWLLLSFLNVEGKGWGWAMTAFGYPMVAASFAVLVLSALSPGSLLQRFRVPGAEQMALWSYAVYLVHKPIFKLAIEPLAARGIDTASAAGITLVMAASSAAGWLLYWAVETPFMRLRSRWFPANAPQRLPAATYSGTAS